MFHCVRLLLVVMCLSVPLACNGGTGECTLLVSYADHEAAFDWCDAMYSGQSSTGKNYDEIQVFADKVENGCGGISDGPCLPSLYVTLPAKVGVYDCRNVLGSVGFSDVENIPGTRKGFAGNDGEGSDCEVITDSLDVPLGVAEDIAHPSSVSWTGSVDAVVVDEDGVETELHVEGTVPARVTKFANDADPILSR